ncbi:hypothetical protein [Hyphomicrobium sp. CS1BSMeth3]|uniref:hypothetical protein n=1 Tax=Hyphomicrobium sp. CS1BSMeth3 TaxID=1892844 RepID=UPI000930CFD2|nr:hypothetical protein [Hyphomicrobium sp. CS1BSMeth3]
MLDDVELSKPENVCQYAWDAAGLPADMICVGLGEDAPARRHLVRQVVAQAIASERRQTNNLQAMWSGQELIVTHPDLGTLVWGQHQTRTLR